MIVSTDSPEIREIAIKAGAEVPWLRKAGTSNDNASTASVLTEVLENLRIDGYEPNFACCIYPVTPLVAESHLCNGFEKLRHGHYNVVFPVVKFSHPIWRAIGYSNGSIKAVFPEQLNTRTQDFQDLFHDAGQWYWFRPEFIHLGLLDNNSGAIELSEYCAQDVDNEDDWIMLQMKYQWNNLI